MDNGSSGRLVNHEEGRGRGSRISRTAAGPSRGGVSASGPVAAAWARSSAAWPTLVKMWSGACARACGRRRRRFLTNLVCLYTKTLNTGGAGQDAARAHTPVQSSSRGKRSTLFDSVVGRSSSGSSTSGSGSSASSTGRTSPTGPSAWRRFGRAFRRTIFGVGSSPPINHWKGLPKKRCRRVGARWERRRLGLRACGARPLGVNALLAANQAKRTIGGARRAIVSRVTRRGRPRVNQRCVHTFFVAQRPRVW